MQASPRAVVEIWLWRRGWVGPLAALCLMVNAVFYLAVWQPRQERMAELDAALDDARRMARQAALPAPAPAAGDARAVIAAAPPADQLIAQMAQLANAEGITLPQSEYRQQLVDGAGVMQLQVTQPVRASYPQLRRYVEAVLRTFPNASLDQLSARRENVTQPQLEARLRWTLWVPRGQEPDRP